MTTIQDLGRPAYRSAGVPLGGAMDRFSAAAANLLVGNPEGAAVLECTAHGPELAVLQACTVALCGGRFELRLNGEQAPAASTVDLRPGDVLDIGHRVRGGRAYLAFAGGIAGDRWLGSLSTYTLVRRGGREGRPLKAGDVLLRTNSGAAARLAPDQVDLAAPLLKQPADLATIGGPHDARLTRAARRTFFSEEFEVAPESDRMGFRLHGPQLEAKSGELLSFGVAPGCVQLTPSGPILLMADHQTAGGYPVIACVSRAGLVEAAQLLPGDRLRFREVKLEAAHAEWNRLRSQLDSLRPLSASA